VQKPADMRHRSLRIAIAFSSPPVSQLRLQIGRWLRRERWIAGPHPHPVAAVTFGAGNQIAPRISEVIESRDPGRTDRTRQAVIADGARHFGGDGHRGIMKRDLLARRPVQMVGYPGHLRMPSEARGEIVQLPGDITRVEPGEPRHEFAVALSVKTVTGDAGTARAGISARQRHQFAGALPFADGRLGVVAGAHRSGSEQDRERTEEPGHPDGNLPAAAAVPERVTRRVNRDGQKSRWRWWGRTTATVCAAAALALAGCKEVPGPRYVRSGADAERGLALIKETGCAACHEIPGIDWPRGRLGPSLAGFDDIGLIAGALPNTPANLAHFVRNAPEAKPGSTMPAMPLSPAEASDVAAYLYGLDDG
jgi:cytochrome c551/c552